MSGLFQFLKKVVVGALIDRPYRVLKFGLSWIICVRQLSELLGWVCPAL